MKLLYESLDMVGLLGHKVGLPPDRYLSYINRVLSQPLTEEPENVFRSERV
jgi:hypothetical protein